MSRPQVAHIVYEASRRLRAVQNLVASQTWQEQARRIHEDSDLYSVWFWLSFGLLHLERMIQSGDPTHLTAVDMMLTSCLAGTWRNYFDVRYLNWQGEKAAIRYWEQYDNAYLETVQRCLAAEERSEKLKVYRQLVKHTLKPVGEVFEHGKTAVILAGRNPREDVQAALNYWQTLVGL